MGGFAMVRQNAMNAASGESLPVHKHIGDRVIAGAIVHGGAWVETLATGSDTWLAALATQVQEATRSRPACKS